jgi:hypothetical protein
MYMIHTLQRTVVFTLLASTSLAFGQLDSNSITVTASRTTTLAPDQASITVAVTTGLNASMDDVLAVLTPAGINSSNFAGFGSGIYFVSIPPAQMGPTVEWDFSVAVPLSKLRDTISQYSALQQAVAQKNNGTTLSFFVTGAQVSAQALLAQSCSLPDLIADARAQAQKLANAAGLSLGGILSMSGVTTTTSSPARSPAYAIVPVCSITVKFAATGIS